MIAIGNDHAATELKLKITQHLDEIGVEYIDCGVATGEKCDYPDMAKTVCDKVISGKAQKGILICGTGIGMAISANKIKEIGRASCRERV